MKASLRRADLAAAWLETGGTNAAALLRGKMAVGQTPKTATAPIRRLIEDGFFIPPLSGTPIGSVALAVARIPAKKIRVYA